MATQFFLPRLSPIQIISAGSFAGLLLITFLTWLALQQPWLGIQIKYQAGQSTLKITHVVKDSPSYKKLKPGDEIHGFQYGNQYVAVTPLYNLEDPDSNPTYALYNEFMRKQSELHQMFKQKGLTIKLKNKDVTIYPQTTRPISSLPITSFWAVIFFGFTAFITVLSIWSFRRGEISIRILAIMGGGFFIGAVFNAVTLSREIVLQGELFYALSSLNLLGIILFALSITALLWNYPKQLSSYPTTFLIYTLYPVIWVNQTWQIIELPLHAYYFHFLVAFAFLVFFAIRQWYQSRDSSTDLAALQWLLLSITISLGITIVFFYIPAIYSTQSIIPVSGAYFAAFMIFLGLILGIIKYKLFNLSRVFLEIWVWIIGGSLLLLIDMALAYMLETTSGETFILSALLVAWAYFPARYWISRKILKLQPRSIEHYFPVLIQKLINIKSPESVNKIWEEILDEIFLPLKITSINEPRGKFEIDNDGAVLLVPSLNNKTTLLLEYQHNGKKLYSRADLKLCKSLYEIIQYTANIKQANEEGMKIERQQIARDLNDDIISHLLKLIQYSDEADVTHKAQEIVSSLRETINSLDTEATIDIQSVLAGITKSITERIELTTIKLNIDTQAFATKGTLNPRQNINLQRIVQEIISNIIKHANASQIDVIIKATNFEIQIEICDDGVGGNIENWVAGKGMNNIKKRILEIHGEVYWNNNEKINTYEINNGCCINFKFPVQNRIQ